MPLTPGTRLGPYEVTAQIGVGGMGEVYRATDTTLGRQVAIKAMPEAFAQDTDRLARFEREARTLAALNHSNIAQIYGLERSGGATALVMELVEGPTLADRIAQGPFAIDEALAVAKQIAEALEAAHEQGIVHRDLKPANIKVRPDGTVKVLDFGLAKAIDTAGSTGQDPAYVRRAGPVGPAGASESPTVTTPAMTQAGMILGTAAYMSPEQARGRPVDKRADIWAFGCVLYEMLTGQRAFEDEDVSLTLSKVLRLEPAFEALPADVPYRVRQALRVCLQKDLRKRASDIHDVRLALEGAFDSAEVPERPGAVPSAPRPPAWRVAWPWALAALVLGGFVGAGVTRTTAPEPAPLQVRRFVHTLPEGQSLPGQSGTLVALSPDGQTLVYRAQADGVWRLYRRALGDLEAVPIEGTEGANDSPFVSPDGQWVAFTLNSVLWRVSLAGGRPVRIAGDAPNLRGASWMGDDTILAGLSARGLSRFRAGGGDAVTVQSPQGPRQSWYPQVLPGGRAALFTLSEARPDGGGVMLLDLESNTERLLIASASAARYLPTGHLVFLRSEDLWAVRFDAARLETIGDPVLVESGIRVEPGGAVQFDVAADGTLAYIAGGTGSLPRALVWVDREGRETPIPAPLRPYRYLHLSRDAARVALDVREGQNDIWLWDFARETLTRLTFDPGNDEQPVWMPDGDRVIFSSTRSGSQSLFWQAADGTGPAERLTDSVDLQHEPGIVSPDGSLLVYEEEDVARIWWSCP
jgi:serine/threonine-protein kinase